MQTKLSDALLKELELFSEINEMRLVTRRLRTIFMCYLQSDLAKEGPFANDVIIDMDRIFNLFDIIEDSQRAERKYP